MKITAAQQKIRLKALSQKGLEDFFTTIGEKPFRARQIMQWLYRHRVDRFDAMKNISAELRSKLDGMADISKLPVKACQKTKDDSAIKIALGLLDGPGEVIECVVLDDGDHRTACLSSQLGCKYGCAYCTTAMMGFHRNLSQLEIVEQLIALQDASSDRISNIVFMGMGEPLDNLETVLAAIDIFQSDYGFVIGGRKITISTCGLVPKIRDLADKETNLGLAISLNAPNDEIRSRLIPINRKYPIEQLLGAAKYYFEKSGRRVTFEYVLIEGVNSSDENLRELQDKLSGFPCKLNLIVFNAKPGSELRGPSPVRIRRILEMLGSSPFTVTLRKSLGTEISAACGQLYQEIAKISNV